MENPALSWLRQKLKLNPPNNDQQRQQMRKLQEEYDRWLNQVQGLCKAIRADDIHDLQQILCAMILSECVYKKDTAEMINAVNEFKKDFGGQLIKLKRVQPCLDHVPHRYLLADSGDTLFTSFIGTKQYRDFIANANIFQGAVFDEDTSEDNLPSDESESSKERPDASTSNLRGTSYEGSQLGSTSDKPLSQTNSLERGFKPAAHQGFLARAKRIPAVELYKLAQKRGLKLVLCGHSLGGAVAVLATLTILRAIPSASLAKAGDGIQVKCITFSQPPVGNAALREYVHRRGWQQHFRTYCIPEDVVPRILSPAYFQHYIEQLAEGDSPSTAFNSSSAHAANRPNVEEPRLQKAMPNEGEQLVLGLGPVQNSFHRLSRLVPLLGVQKQFDWFRRRRENANASLKEDDSDLTLKETSSLQALEIHEGADGITFRPSTDANKISSEVIKTKSNESKESRKAEYIQWYKVPNLPAYVPFGQLHLLEKLSVEPLSASEYATRTSVQSVLMVLREGFQSHSMKSYRSRFHKIYELCMNHDSVPIQGIDHHPQQPHLQKRLEFTGADAVEIGNIAEPHVIRTATSIVPLGWSGVPGEKNSSEPLRVDVHGYSLHMCTLFQAQVNGFWCSATVETLPLPLSGNYAHKKLQRMRIQIGAPLKQAPMKKHYATYIDSSATVSDDLPDQGINATKLMASHQDEISNEAADCQHECTNEVIIHCTSDFVAASRKVYMRTRRIRLLGLEGAGKTSLFSALLGQARGIHNSRCERILPDNDWQEGVARGICFIDPVGVNLQDLPAEATHLKKELSIGLGQLNKKIDLVILVHNLAHKIPRLHYPLAATHSRPALSLLLDEVDAAGVPWVLAITNKFAVSADQLKLTAKNVVETYQVHSNMFVVVNSCAYAVHGIGTELNGWNSGEITSKELNANNRIQGSVQRLISAPISLVQMPFRKKEVILPIEGVNTLWKIIQHVLMSNEESAFQELARERLLIEEAREKSEIAVPVEYSNGKADSVLAATVGAALGAGLGIIISIIKGAASSSRKP